MGSFDTSTSPVSELCAKARKKRKKTVPCRRFVFEFFDTHQLTHADKISERVCVCVCVRARARARERERERERRRGRGEREGPWRRR